MEDLHASNGPVSTLPGSSHSLPAGTMCEDHKDRPAVRRIQGETDSFGCEYHFMCQACLDEYKAAIQAEREEVRCCDWCKQPKSNLRPRRDMDEGRAGPVYDVCGDCIRKENEEATEEMNYWEDRC